MKLQRLLSLGMVTAACAVLLSACGGGDDKDPTVTPVPPTATAVPAAPTATIAPTLAPAQEASPSSVATTAADLPAAAGTPVAVTIILTDFRISAFQKEFEVGKTYSFTIQNNGGVPHQLMIEPQGAVNQPLTSGDQTALVNGIAPGATVTLMWTFTEAGTFQFASHESNYYEQGMVQGPLTVK